MRLDRPVADYSLSSEDDLRRIVADGLAFELNSRIIARFTWCWGITHSLNFVIMRFELWCTIKEIRSHVQTALVELARRQL